jgi:predicted nucleic acid-binding protein
VILVDTSVWIDFLKNVQNEATDKLNTVLDLRIPFGITGHIYQELLQGVSAPADFQRLKEYLDTFTLYAPLHERDSYAEAARIYFSCRRKGITVRSSIDCLIVQIAREHNLKLLHNDRDFDQIKKVVPQLNFF